MTEQTPDAKTELKTTGVPSGAMLTACNAERADPRDLPLSFRENRRFSASLAGQARENLILPFTPRGSAVRARQRPPRKPRTKGLQVANITRRAVHWLSTVRQAVGASA